MVRDLEELVLLVQDEAVRRQIREAVRCYHAGAYRAAVVMAVAAGMHDLRRRVDELVTTGAGNLRRLRDDVNAQANNEQAWEQMLLDGCRRDELISIADYQKLCLLLRTRHLCAHPTGHVGAAEEARDAIASLIDLVLSKPTQAGGQEVTELVAQRLPHGQYLASTPAEVVNRELSRLQPRVFRFLAREVAGKLEDADQDLARNAAIFLAEMTKLHAGPFSDAAAVAIVEIERMLATGSAVELLRVFSHVPESLAQLDAIARGRLIDVLRRNPIKYMPTTDALVLSGVVSEAEREKLFMSAEAVSCNTRHAGQVLKSIQWPKLRSRVSDWLIDDMASSTFTTANSAVELFAELLSSGALDYWSVETQRRAVFAMIQSAGWGARRSERMCRDGLPAPMVNAFIHQMLDSPTPPTDHKEIEKLAVLVQSSLEGPEIVEYLERLLDGSSQPSPKQVQYREDFLRRAFRAVRDLLQEVVSLPDVDFSWLDERLYRKLATLRPEDESVNAEPEMTTEPEVDAEREEADR